MSVPGSRNSPYDNKNEDWIYFKYITANLLRKIPRISKLIIPMWRLIKRCMIWANSYAAVLYGKWKGYYGSRFDVDHIFWVDPHDIVYSSRREFEVSNYKGKVIGGAWDLLENKFDELDIFEAVQAVCVSGDQWKDTVFYQRVLTRLKAGHILWGCASQLDFDQRCKNLEMLYKTIHTEGYKTQNELVQQQSQPEPRSADDEEIGINIGRFGDILFSDGAHRLVIARVLEMQKIPVKIAARHIQWAEFRKRLVQYSAAHGAQNMPPIPHLDTSELPYNQEYERIFEVIQQDLHISVGSILDIGAHLGYFCHRFEEQGLDCYALEDSPEELYLLRGLHRARNRQFKIFDNPIASFEPPPGLAFNAILVLDTLLQIENQPKKLVELLICLRRLTFQRLYVLIPEQQEGEGSDRGPLAALVSQLDIKWICPLYKTADGNTLFRLSGSEFC